MDNDAIDFTDLDSEGDAQRFDMEIDRISAAAAPILARRRLQKSVWWQISAWRKPVYAVGIAMMLLLYGMTQFGTQTEEVEPLTDDLSVALGVPAPMSGMVASTAHPTTAQVLYPGEAQ